MDGTSLSGYLDNTLLAQCTDTDISAGNPGIRSYTASYTVDNLCVTSPAMDTLLVLPYQSDFSVGVDGWSCINGSWSIVEENGQHVLIQTQAAGEAISIVGHPLWKDYTVIAGFKLVEINYLAL